MSAYEDYISRGKMRAFELTYTVQFASTLTFPDPSSGRILHQMPTRKREIATGNPE